MSAKPPSTASIKRRVLVTPVLGCPLSAPSCGILAAVMPEPPYPIPKRGSGRTGRRRQTLTEAKLAGPRAERDWIRRYGDPGPAMPPLKDPPDFFEEELRLLWISTLQAAPPGLLTLVDGELFLAHIVAMLSPARQAAFAGAFQRGVPKAAARCCRRAPSQRASAVTATLRPAKAHPAGPAEGKAEPVRYDPARWHAHSGKRGGPLGATAALSRH
jgi:hypothetical protein